MAVNRSSRNHQLLSQVGAKNPFKKLAIDLLDVLERLRKGHGSRHFQAGPFRRRKTG
jgi:hypothetical protein